MRENLPIDLDRQCTEKTSQLSTFRHRRRRDTIYSLFLLIILCSLMPTIQSATTGAQRFWTRKVCPVERLGCRCVPGIRTECCCLGLHITEIPKDLAKNMKSLILFNTSLTTITKEEFERYSDIEELDIGSTPSFVHFDADLLAPLKNLRKLSITECKNLDEITGVLIKPNHRMQSIILRDNGLRRMPALEMTWKNKMEVDLDLSGNEIAYLGDGRVRGIRARTFRLSHNRIKEIAGHAFQDSIFLNLILSHNRDLVEISKEAFKGIHELHNLDLSHTSIYELPILGLKNLESLTLKNVPNLKQLPPVLSFTHLKKAHFTYPHHCCLFKHVDHAAEFRNNSKEIHERICKEMGHRVSQKLRKRRQIEMNTSKNANPLLSNVKEPLKVPSDFYDFLASFAIPGSGEAIDEMEELPPYSTDELGVSNCLEVEEIVRNFYFNITCIPEPDALNPCENIVGYPLLRRSIWVVWIAAIVGNALVWLVLAMAYEKRVRVHYFFMLNLSVADLITGIYLALLAIEDTRTADEYYRYAVAWQTGWGCSTAGFLAVFASQLSIISMFFIAFEMAYNTRKALYGKRLEFWIAFMMMASGWLFAGLMASLPLLGVSSYSTTSICLPLKVSNIVDKTYVIFGLFFNILAFIGMAVCYVFIYWMLKLEDPETPSRAEDTAVITKMALLIATDMFCWFPTLFFGLTAALGYPLISLSNAKIFLVFFFPINSFANPFLYVFFTKVIQRHVKKKAIPVLRRIASTPGITLTTLSNFYQSHPNGEKRMRNEESLSSPTQNRLLGVTQMTSLMSTPRGSNGSNRVDELNERESFDIGEPRKSSPRVSFQDEPACSHRSSSEVPRKHGLLKKISAIPEMSDVSEHSGDSNHEHIPKMTNKKRPSLALRSSRYSPIRDDRKSIGQDSGRGSLASISTNNDALQQRLSLATQDGQSDEEIAHCRERGKRMSEPFLQPIFQLGLAVRDSQSKSSSPSHNSNSSSSPSKSLFRWPLSGDRRRSVPAIKPLLVVTECSDNSSNA